MDVDLDELDPAELAEYKKKQKKREEAEAEQEKLLEDIKEREAEREREEERDNELKKARLQRIKDREVREIKRAEQEAIRLKKKEEEWARKREFEEARKREREEKLKQLQADREDKQKQSVSTGVNALDIVKQNLEIAAAKKQQTEEEKTAQRENAVRRRCQEYDERFDRMRESELVAKATELRDRWEHLEGEKYDIEMIFKKQDYDIRELLVRINEITRRRRKTIHLGGSRRMQADEEEKSYLGVKGMVDKYVNIVAEKNKAPKKKEKDLPKKQISESEDAPPEPEPEPEPVAAEDE
ncbi:troponin T-like [Symsagittifera roscoffensis]|uniref:troponin T-like n=1 Tax=Symsagittifera roscoffensis TaxID=84072 RepID=UPI00307B7EC9